MGNSKSSQDQHLVGFRVRELSKGSPAAKSGLMEMSDYILSINEKSLRKMDPSAIGQLIKANENKQIALKVFNENTAKVRDVYVTPTRDWPGEGLLGLIIRLEKYDPHSHSHSRTSTGDFSITFDDVYTKDNPIARKSSVISRSPKGKDRSVDNVSGSNILFQSSSPSPSEKDKSRTASGRRRSQEPRAAAL